MTTIPTPVFHILCFFAGAGLYMFCERTLQILRRRS